jgi:hypothetical protein
MKLNPDGTDNLLVDFGFYLRRQDALSPSPIGVLAASDVENAIRDVPGVWKIAPDPSDLTLGATRMTWDETGLVFTTGWTIAPARQDIRIDKPDATGLPASANFPRLGTITLTNGRDGSPL